MSSKQHGDTGLGHIALKQELLNAKQIRQCRAICTERKRNGESANLGEVMVEQGYLTREQLTSVRAEERQRRYRIPGYEILNKVGAGAVGIVYLARQIAMERDIALKILHPRLSSNRETIKKYINEARAVAKLNHPHIVQAIDVGEANGYYYFSMEFLSGGTFADLLESEGFLEEKRAMVFMYQMASALQHAWEHTIIHCDIKPANIMLDEAGRLKVTDLGLAQVGDMVAFQEQGKKRVVRGTPHYVSPEQIERPTELDCRTDIYSLGATFYHLLSGEFPFNGENSKEIMLARLKTRPRPLGKVMPGTSKELTRLIHDMMEVNPDKRPKDPKELMVRLVDLGVDPSAAGDILGSIPTPSPKANKRLPSRPERQRPSKRRSTRGRALQQQQETSHIIWLGTGILLVVVLIMLVVYVLFLQD